MQKKVLYLLDYAPNYRDKFLQELGKHVDLTVAAYPGSEIDLKDPDKRVGYKFISLDARKFFKFRFNFREWTIVNGDFDVIIIGFVLWYPIRMLNLFRTKKRVISAGIIFGAHNDLITRVVRKIFLQLGEGFLVYSKITADKIKNQTQKPVLVFNNTYFSRKEITPLSFPPLEQKLHILWVGRYGARKKIERLYDLAKRNKRVEVRLIGPGIEKQLGHVNIPNLTILDEVYGDELASQFAWSHCVFNPGHVGLLVMNTARFGRPIFLDSGSRHAPEISLAKEAQQDLIDFSNQQVVDSLVEKCLNDIGYLEKKASDLVNKMNSYTLEFMTGQFLKAIEGMWDE